MAAKLVSVHPVLMVRDVSASIHFYEQLGFTRAFQDAEQRPMYAGIRRDGVELHLQWHDAAEWTSPRPQNRPTYRFYVEDVDGLYAELLARGITGTTQLGDTPWGTREFHLRDPDDNGLQFYRDL